MGVHEKVLEGLEKLANAEGHPLHITIDRDQGDWIIKFSAGSSSAVQTKLASFSRSPTIVLEPFCEEMVKRIK